MPIYGEEEDKVKEIMKINRAHNRGIKKNNKNRHPELIIYVPN